MSSSLLSLMRASTMRSTLLLNDCIVRVTPFILRISLPTPEILPPLVETKKVTVLNRNLPSLTDTLWSISSSSLFLFRWAVLIETPKCLDSYIQEIFLPGVKSILRISMSIRESVDGLCLGAGGSWDCDSSLRSTSKSNSWNWSKEMTASLAIPRSETISNRLLRVIGSSIPCIFCCVLMFC